MASSLLTFSRIEEKKLCTEMRLLLFLLLVVLASCHDEPTSLPLAKGTPSELLVVLPSALVDSPVADTLLTLTDCDAPGLGAQEPIFRTMTIGARGYKGMYRLMHSQLLVAIDSAAPTPRLGVAHDVSARGQLQLRVSAATPRQLASYLGEHREHIQQVLLDFQLQRRAQLLAQHHSQPVSEAMRRMGYQAHLPTELRSTKGGKHFLWASTNRGGDRDVNFVFYTLPWRDIATIDASAFARMRDSVMQANIPGSQPGQWMETQRNPASQPVVWLTRRMLQGQSTLEVRGLWSMHGGFMGGPFVSWVRTDSVRRHLVVSEGFVFSPNSAKRDLLRSVEASLRTVRPL